MDGSPGAPESNRYGWRRTRWLRLGCAIAWSALVLVGWVGVEPSEQEGWLQVAGLPAVIVGGAYLVAPGRIGLALVAIVSIPVGLWIFVVLGLGAEAFREDALFLATVVALAVAGLTSLGTIAFLVGSSLGWFFEP